MHDDAVELREWIRRYTPQLLNVARAFCSAADDPEDLLQETWIIAHEKRKQLSAAATAGAWLHAILINVARSRLRRRKRREALFSLWRGHEPQHENTLPPDVGKALEHATLWRAVADLPDLQRRVVLLRIVDDMSTAQAAAVIGVAEGTVKASLHRALNSLRRHYGDER